MANTGLRPDEARHLQYRDVTIVEDGLPDERILEIEVRGKRGVGYCKSMPGAVLPYQRLREAREAGQPKLAGRRAAQSAADRPGLPGQPHQALQRVLRRGNLKIDRDGNKRTAYSLRHTYICLRLMEGADIYQLAKNCRTSVEMIEKFYAAHIKDLLDASAINVMRPRRKMKKSNSRTPGSVPA